MDKGTCSVNGCDRPSRKRGWCEAHYQRWRQNGEPGPAVIAPRDGGRWCSVAGCGRVATSRGWCSLHYTRWRIHGDELATLNPTRGLPVADKWSAYVARTAGCWLWTGSRAGGSGYGHFTHDGVTLLAHRFAYEHLVGPIPDGLHLDHLCRVRHCVNPAHLEPVTPKENVFRALGGRTHCKYGHEFTPENTYRAPKTGRRSCVACRKEAGRLWRAGLAAGAR